MEEVLFTIGCTVQSVLKRNTCCFTTKPKLIMSTHNFSTLDCFNSSLNLFKVLKDLRK